MFAVKTVASLATVAAFALASAMAADSPVQAIIYDHAGRSLSDATLCFSKDECHDLKPVQGGDAAALVQKATDATGSGQEFVFFGNVCRGWGCPKRRLREGDSTIQGIVIDHAGRSLKDATLCFGEDECHEVSLIKREDAANLKQQVGKTNSTGSPSEFVFFGDVCRGWGCPKRRLQAPEGERSATAA